jgi:hypothetical protein
VHGIFSTKDRQPFLHSEEIREIFKRHRVAFDERYVWDCPPRGSDALVRQSLDCLLGIAPRDAGLGVLSGRSARLRKAARLSSPKSYVATGFLAPTYHNMRGAIASATAAWAILLDRSAVARKCPNSRPALKRRRRPSGTVRLACLNAKQLRSAGLFPERLSEAPSVLLARYPPAPRVRVKLKALNTIDRENQYKILS